MLAAPPPAAPSPDADFAQESLVVERLRTTCRFEADGTGSKSIAARVSIRNDSGVKASGQIPASYDAGFETVTIKGRVIKPDGVATEIPPSAVQEVSSPVVRLAPIYSDIREKHLVVPGLGVGDILEYEIQVVRTAALCPGHFWSSFDFNRHLIVKDEELRLDLPVGKYVNVKAKPGLAPEIKEAGDRRIYTWKSSHLVREDAGKREKRSSLEPSEDDSDVQISTFRTFAEIGDWYAGLERDRRVPDAAIRAKVVELVQGKTTDVAKLQAIYNYVAQKYRYVGLMFGLGRFQPHAASEIFTNQYGDCKDKHTLLAAMGEAAGLQVQAALTSATRKVDPTFPSPDQFDHVISHARLGGTDLWFDTTTEVAPFRMLMPTIRGQSALIVSPGGKSELGTVPKEPSVQNAGTTEVDGTVDDHGTLDADARITLRGDLELVSRITFRAVPASRWKEFFGPLVSDSGMPEGDLSNIQMSDLSNPDVPLQMAFHVKSTNFFNRFESAATLKLPFGRIALDHVQPGRDSSPIRLGSRKVEYRAKLRLPLQFTPRPPLPVALKRDYAEYTSRYALDGDILSAERILTVKVEELPAERQTDLEAFERTVATDFDQVVVVKNAGAVGPEGLTGKSDEKLEAYRTAYASGNYHAAAELAESVIKAEPSHKSAYADLGRAYLALGDFRKAETALKKAVELNPYSPDAFANLGVIYQAMDRDAEAEKAFRKQAEINPLDGRAHGLLGHFLVERKKYAEAASELEKATAIDPRAAGFVDLGRAWVQLDRMQQAQEAFDRALELSPTPGVQNEIATTLAMHKTGIERAREVALAAEATLTTRLRDLNLTDLQRQDLPLVKQLGDCWANLGMVELQAGNTAAAERYLTAAWELTQDGRPAYHLGQLYERDGKRAQAIDYYAFASASPRPEPASRDRLAALMGPNPNVYAVKIMEKRTLLVDLRSFPVPGARGDGVGDFFVMLSADAHVEEVRFASGDASVKPLAEALKKVSFKLTLPDDSEIRLFRRGILLCLPGRKTAPSSCEFILIPPEAVHSLN
jgi:Tfp pilus assembly protein PilF